MAKAALKTAPKRDEWMWMVSVNDKHRWSTTQIPNGDIHAPIVKQLSTNSDGSYSFVVYRDMKLLGSVRHKSQIAGLKEAQDLARSGKRIARADADNKAMLAYVDGKTRDAKEYAKLSKEAQQCIADVYPWALPSNRALDVAKVAAPKTTRTDLMGKREKAAARSGKYNLDATIKRIKDGNPKKPGTGQHQRWVTIFAFDGKTVREYLNGGGDKYGIDQTLEFGYCKLIEPK